MIPTLRTKTAFSAAACFLWTQSVAAAEGDRPAQPAASSADSSATAPSESGPSNSEGGSSAEEPPTIEEAREAFLLGRRLISEGRWTEAEEQFLFAIQVKNTPGLRYYIGYCREKRGLLVEALQSYRLAEDLLETQKAPDVDEIVPVAIERVRVLLPVLILYDVPSNARLEFDGVERPLSGQFHANPGSHELVIEKEGFTPFTASVVLTAGQKSRVQVKMEPQDVATETVADQEPARPQSQQLRRVLFWSSTGVAALGLGTGVAGAVLFSSTKRKIDELNDEADEISDGEDGACNNPTSALERTCEDLARGAKRKNTMGNVMIGGFIGAGVGTLGAVVTHFFWPKAPVRVEVGISGEGSSILFGGHF